MAYVSKEDKVKIVAAVKAVLPKGWKVTFKVQNYSRIVATVWQAPFDLADVLELSEWELRNGYKDVNTYHADKVCKTDEMRQAVAKIIDALNTDNYDNSDVMTDYFDVGHYIGLHFGDHAKPFKNSLK